MKTRALLSIVSTLIVVSAYGQSPKMPPPQKKILIEKLVHVGFAPPERLGTYRFQVLSNGEVLSVDNKNHLTQVAVLAMHLVEQVEKAITVIPHDLILKEEDGPRCDDVPSTSTTIFKVDKSKVLIKSSQACKNAVSENYVANNLAQWSDNLQSALDRVIYFGDEKDSAPARIGQEGYGAPALRDESGFLGCEEEVLIADDGFRLRLEGIPGTANTFYLIVERSLFVGPVTETYIVTDKTNPKLLGSPARYENEEVKLSVQGTTTPRPDGKFVGSFVKKGVSGHFTENRKLLCSYNNK
jgi:hypothetical protein